ncbi:hypothetical protein XF36_04515 [Pseudonocardia sp. HH130629-09]|nr:hypothetical protein XF36_04515 [Pseudonocardia sp. HH130629-09]
MVGGTATAFHRVEEELVAWQPCDVARVMERLDAVTASGRWAFGFVTYEAASGLGTGLRTRSPVPGLPLAWFGVAEPRPAPPLQDADPPPVDLGWRPEWTADRHRRAVDAVQENIAAGETYQCNLTTSLRASAPADPEQLYRQMVVNQIGRYNALIDTGRFVVASASPELFFEVSGDWITMRPMKGTAPRGRTGAEDAEAVDRLRSSPKERAENIMIVDLVRNDLARIAVPGTVAVADLLRPERFPTVHQLTSTVRAELPPGVGTADLFRALFPCGSVTGAPKRRTMEIIRELEGDARGVYCGAVGVVGPRDAPVRARFSVAIRSALVDRERGVVTYGTGGGITWDSAPAAEWSELLVKARLLDEAPRDFHLIETMRHDPGSGIHLRDDHLARIAASARYFGFRHDPGAVARELDRHLTGAGPARVRLCCHRDGTATVDVGPLPPATAGPVRLATDDEPVDTSTCWTRHKTSRREVYEVRRARHPEADDVILIDDAGAVVETGIATLAARIEGRWWTPPASVGCLPGIERGHRIRTGTLRERPLAVADLDRADELAVLSSLRGWRPAVLLHRPAVH